MEFGQHVGKQILNWIKEYKREWESEHSMRSNRLHIAGVTPQRVKRTFCPAQGISCPAELAIVLIQ